MSVVDDSQEIEPELLKVILENLILVSDFVLSLHCRKKKKELTNQRDCLLGT
jgi:hypothetical protein